MGKNQAERKHDNIVNQLEEILHLENDYQTWQFLEYNKSDHFVRDLLMRSGGGRVSNPVGEVDLLRQIDDYWEFYEIKSRYSKKTYYHAKGQYARFRNHFKGDSIVGFMYCGDKLIRF